MAIVKLNMVKILVKMKEVSMARRARNIYKRKDGRYEGRYVKGRNENGTAIYGSVYARTYAEVKKKLEQAILNCRATETPAVQRTVVNQSETYLSTIQSKIELSTYGIYKRYIDLHIVTHFSDIQCGQLTVELLQEFIDKLIDKGLSASTVRVVFSFLKSSLRDAVSCKIFEVTLPKCLSSKAEALTVSEQKRLERTAKRSGDINHIGMMLCLYTGVRVGELCGLMWDDIDFERRILHVRRTIQRIKNKNYVGEDVCNINKTTVACLMPKSDTSLRSIPLPEFLLSLLNKHRNRSCGSDGYVLSNGDSFIEPRNMQYRFKKLLTDASVKSINFHATRHTFATRALEAKFDIKTLSEILGHSSATITLKIYAHAMDEHKRRSMESLTEIYQLAS